MIDQVKVIEQIGIFKERLSPKMIQRDALARAERDVMEQLAAEAKAKGQPLERVFITALCGEIITKRQRAEFLTRLILLDLLLGD